MDALMAPKSAAIALIAAHIDLLPTLTGATAHRGWCSFSYGERHMLKSKSLCEQIARTCGWTQVDGQIYKLLEHVPADGDQPNALYANKSFLSNILPCCI